ncbi:MAG: AbrB/MazE/SpoVT family DNA-binding domain-containing protein [Sphingomonadaceae bacterium]|nr:AbrB/MazE/SpoVT family DNA-binding domain-containing protein [Sphingomonadaceae bacterium]
MATKVRDEVKITGDGRVTLPADVRARRQWDTGTRLIVEDRPDGVLLRTVTVDDLFGSAGYTGPAKTIEEMDEAIALEVARRYALGRY